MAELILFITICFFCALYYRGVVVSRREAAIVANYEKKFTCSQCGKLAIPVYGEYNGQAREQEYWCAQCVINYMKEKEKSDVA
jgi:hypothetical protein